MLPEPIALNISQVIYNADCLSRYQLINGVVDYSERSYMGAVAGIAAANLMQAKFYRRLVNFRISTRDTHAYDSLFVFRVGNEVKIGICEAKLLRFHTPTRRPRKLSYTWDWEAPAKESHFYNQIDSFKKWPDEIAKWCMLILDLNRLVHFPPLDINGSSCAWHSDMEAHIDDKSITVDHLWTLQDILGIGNRRLKNLQEVIYEILICNVGGRFDVPKRKNGITINPKDGGNPIEIPLPYRGRNDKELSSAQNIDKFLKENNLVSYVYFNFTEMLPSNIESFKSKLG